MQILFSDHIPVCYGVLVGIWVNRPDFKEVEM